MNDFRTRLQPRAGLVAADSGLNDGTLVVQDAALQQRWHLSPVESLVWQGLASIAGVSLSAWVQALCEKHPQQLTSARVWAALDALSDRGLLVGRATPPALEAVTHHQRLNRRQWAVAGLAMAAAPAAFAATAAAAEEKAKADVQAPTEDAAAKRRQEQEMKRQERAMQEEQQKQQRTAEQNQKRDKQVEQGAARVQEQQQKREVRQQEEDSKRQGRKDEQSRKKIQTKDKAHDDAPKPF